MIQASTSLILTGLTITGGRIAQDVSPLYSDPMIVGGMIVVFGIAGMNTISPSLAGAFSLLIFVSAFLYYGPSLMTSLGFQLKPGSTTTEGTA